MINDKELNIAIGLIDTTLLVNAIEYPVVQEVRSQIHNLSPEASQKLKLVEVVAYCLNRLPSMYATTKDGYRNQYNIATGELRSKISDMVRRGIRSLLVGDPLHDPYGISDELFCDPSGLLSRLCQLFNRKQMRWKEVPSVLQSLMSDNSDVDLPGEPLPQNPNSFRASKHNTSDITSYLKRSKLRTATRNSYKVTDDNSNSNSSWKAEAMESERAAMLEQQFELYTLKGNLKYINVTEKFVMVAALHLSAELSSNDLDLIEVVAYTLNHSPQMYATSERGLTILRQKYQTELPVLIEQVRKSFAKIKYSTRLQSEPLYFADFNNEYQEALTALSKMLDRDDLSPDNLIDVVKEFIA